MNIATESAIDTVNNVSDMFSLQLQMTVRGLTTLLEELLEKQQSLIKYLETLNGQLDGDETIQKVHLTMLHTHQYHKKLLQIRKDILDIHTKFSKLKGRVQKLQAKQEEEMKIRLQNLQRKEEIDRLLIAKPAKDAL